MNTYSGNTDFFNDWEVYEKKVEELIGKFFLPDSSKNNPTSFKINPEPEIDEKLNSYFPSIGEKTNFFMKIVNFWAPKIPLFCKEHCDNYQSLRKKYQFEQNTVIPKEERREWYYSLKLCPHCEIAVKTIEKVYGSGENYFDLD